MLYFYITLLGQKKHLVLRQRAHGLRHPRMVPLITHSKYEVSECDLSKNSSWKSIIRGDMHVFPNCVGVSFLVCPITVTRKLHSRGPATMHILSFQQQKREKKRSRCMECPRNMT